MQIVHGDLSRVDDVGPLFQAMHEHHRSLGPQALPFRTADEAWTRRRSHYVSLLSGGRGTLLLAEEDGRVIGYAMVSVGGGQATLTTGERVAELETLSVAEGERDRGVGRALMDAAYAVIRELGATEVMLYVLEGNDRATRFYERYGLQPYLRVMLGSVTEPGADRRSARTRARDGRGTRAASRRSCRT